MKFKNILLKIILKVCTELLGGNDIYFYIEFISGRKQVLETRKIHLTN